MFTYYDQEELKVTRKFARQLRVKGRINSNLRNTVLKDIDTFEKCRQIVGQKVNLYSLIQSPPRMYEDFHSIKRQRMGAWKFLLAIRFNSYSLDQQENVRLGRIMPVLVPYAADRGSPLREVALLTLTDIWKVVSEIDPRGVGSKCLVSILVWGSLVTRRHLRSLSLPCVPPRVIRQRRPMDFRMMSTATAISATNRFFSGSF